MTEIFFNNNGEEIARYDLCPAEGSYALQFPKGMWHTVIVNEPCIIFEAKDGKFEPLREEDLMNTKSLNERTQLIDSLRKAIKDCNTTSIIAIKMA